MALCEVRGLPVTLEQLNALCVTHFGDNFSGKLWVVCKNMGRVDNPPTGLIMGGRGVLVNIVIWDK